MPNNSFRSSRGIKIWQTIEVLRKTGKEESNMCGIIGFISKSENSVKDVFDTNYQSILDRGRYFKKVELPYESYGYVRLPTDAIEVRSIDEIQKLQNSYLLYNGLITNTEDLCKLFFLPDEIMQSDTQCLHHGFSSYNVAFLSHCRGMFAFAHITQESITLVRDTIGIKPLYYVNTEQIFGFCSEIKGLKNLMNAQVYETLPGEIITYHKKTKRIIKGIFSYDSYKRYQKTDLKKCLIESVVVPTRRYLLQSNKKNVAILLSGGVDSSLLLGLLAQNLSQEEKKRVIGFCVGLTDAPDTIIAHKLASSLQIKLIHVLPFSEKEALEKIPEIVYKVESIHARVARVALLQDALAKKIKEMGIEVVLSGEGADELFYGYERFINGLQKEQIQIMFTYFFHNVFCYTLLQRYERIFAKQQIEGRVPFLDQELVELAKQFTVEEKIQQFSQQVLSKIPIRLLAKEIGLPEYVYDRPKIKMTVGATKKINEDSEEGYLEAYIQQKRKMTFSHFVQEIYRHYFSFSVDLLANGSLLGSEEEAMRIVKEFIRNNEKARLKCFR
jgi:asparagine synthetase B (glutamine-hydrolysing)